MKEKLIGFLMGVVVVILLYILTQPDSVWQQQVVEAGHGEYNPTTGKFQFLPPCK